MKFLCAVLSDFSSATSVNARYEIVHARVTIAAASDTVRESSSQKCAHMKTTITSTILKIMPLEISEKTQEILESQCKEWSLSTV